MFLTTFIPPGPNVTQCVPSEGGGRIFGVALRNSRKVFQDFENDGDGDGRSTRAAAPGLTGEVGLAGLDTLTAGAQTFKPNVAPYVPIYWRERRGDDEPVPKN